MKYYANLRVLYRDIRFFIDNSSTLISGVHIASQDRRPQVVVDGVYVEAHDCYQAGDAVVMCDIIYVRVWG